MIQKFGFKQSERGMSLIEIIVVIVMIAIVAYPLMGLAKANLNGLVEYSRVQKAQFDLQSQMEQVLADYSSLGYDGIISGWDGKTGKTNSGLYNYIVKFTDKGVVKSGITTAMVTVTLTGAQLKYSLSLTTMISKQ